jgi:uncharacterized protein
MKSSELRRRAFIKSMALATAGLGLDSVTNLATAVRAVTGSQQMPRRELGKTGVTIPILHLGTAQSMDPVYDKVMHRCLGEGVDWIDTAMSYGWGSSHKAIANFVSQIGNRKKVWITTKSSSWTSSGFEKDADKCRDQLKTDFLDLYLIHGINDPNDIDPAYLKAGDNLKRTGKIRLFGFSIHGGDQVGALNKAAKIGGIDAIMFRYNFRQYNDRDLNLAIDACKKAGIGLIAMKTMGGVSAKNEKVLRFKSQNFSLAQAKLKSVWADERIDSIVSEMQNVQQAKENAAAAKSVTALAAGEFHQLNLLAAKTDHLACIGCSHICESRITGKTRIADQLRFLTYFEAYGKEGRAREMYHSLPPERRSFNEKDLAEAMKACPQKINIPARLKKAELLLV